LICKEIGLHQKWMELLSLGQLCGSLQKANKPQLKLSTMRWSHPVLGKSKTYVLYSEEFNH